MAAPRNRFGTHQCTPFVLGKLHHILHIRGEFRRLHVISISAKRRVAPGTVDRYPMSMPQSAKPRQMRVFDARYFREPGSVSLLNCGLCRDRGTVRTSRTCATSFVFNRLTNSSNGCVECPIVHIKGSDADCFLLMALALPHSPVSSIGT